MASTTFSGPVTSNNGFISGSGSVVTLSSDTTLTSASHAGRVMLLDKSAGGLTATLPAASGSGNVYKFFVKGTLASGNYIIKVASSDDTMSGVAVVANDDDDSANIFQTASDSDTITLDGSTKGGILGGMVELQDLYSGKYLVKIHQSATGTEATPFSATV